MKSYRALLAVGSLFFLHQQVYAFDEELERKKIESSIKIELSQELSRVTQESQYLLFVSVQGGEKAIALESTPPALLTESKEEIFASEQDFLPGFVAVPKSDIEEKTRRPIESEERVKDVPPFRRYEVTNISVDILHPPAMDTMTVNSLNRMFTERLQRLYGAALVQVRFERMGTSSKPPEEAKAKPPESVEKEAVERISAADELAGFLVRNFFPIVFLLLIGLGLFLLTIILLFLMWTRSSNTKEKGEKVIVKNIRSWEPRSPTQKLAKNEEPFLQREPRISKYPKLEEPLEKTEEEIQELQRDADRLETDFSKIFTQEPLISRRYIQELLSTDRDLLLSVLSSSVFRGAVATLMGMNKQEGVGWKNLLKNLLPEDQIQKRVEIFKRQIKDLQSYQDLMHTQIGDGSLGKLSFLSSEELDRVLSDLDAGDVVQVLRHIRPELLKDFMRNMSETRRKDLLTRGLEEQKSISDERKEMLTKKLSNRVDEIEKTIFTSKASQDQILGYLLETSQDRRSLLDNIRRKDENMYRKYEHYGIGLEDFLRERDTGLVNMVLESLENEDLVIICLNLPARERERILGILPGQRKSLIQNMVSASGGAGTDLQAFEVAKEKLIHCYRARRKMKV